MTDISISKTQYSSNVLYGEFDYARIPNLNASKITAGTLSSSRIPNLNASKITGGTLADARIPNLNASKITVGTLADAIIPNLNASKITGGTLADARIPNLNASKITGGTLADARIPNLNASKITAGTLSSSRIPPLGNSKISDMNASKLTGTLPNNGIFANSAWYTSADNSERLYFATNSHTYIKSHGDVVLRTGNSHNDAFKCDSSRNIYAYSQLFISDWIRPNNTNLKFYGGSGQMYFRTNGTTQVSNNGGYPYIFAYGNGDDAGKRLVIIGSDGNIWCKKYNTWLDSAFIRTSAGKNRVTTSSTYYIIGYGGNDQTYLSMKSDSADLTELSNYSHTRIRSRYGAVEIWANGRSHGSWNFTAAHRCLSDEKNIYNTSNIGKIVVATGEYTSSKCERGKLAITISEAEPTVEISNETKDKRVIGVIAEFESDGSTVRNVDDIFDTAKINVDRRIVVNAVGEGSILVCNKNGKFQNGDFIVSSSVKGFGEKQDDDILHNYTVAKITMDCSFEDIIVPRKEMAYDIKEILYYENAKSYWNGKYDSNFEYDSNSDTFTMVYKKQYVTPMKEYNVTNSNGDILHDEYNNPITINEVERIQKVDKKKDYKKNNEGAPVWIYSRDEESNIIYESKYELLYLDEIGNKMEIEDWSNYSGIKYLGAFVGCIYHCG